MGKLLRSRVYLGEIFHGEYVNAHAHLPLIDAATWEAAQSPRHPQRHPRLPTILVGVARCASCRHAMVSYHARNCRNALFYRCTKFHAAGECPAPAIIKAAKLEPYVFEAMLRIVQRRQRRKPLERLAALEARALAAQQAVERYRDNDRVAAVIGKAAFIDGLTKRQDRLQEARLEVFDARARLKLDRVPPADEIREQWSTMPAPDKRRLLRSVLDAVFVAQGRVPAPQRVTICPAGTGPRGLPHPGRTARPPRPIKPRREWINPRPR